MPRYQGQAFSCANPRGRFHTDTSGRRGFPHLPSLTPGSALPEPLFRDGERSLWLEHVVDENAGRSDPVWLMWYDHDGNPELDMSTVFTVNDLSTLVGSLVNLLKGDAGA